MATLPRMGTSEASSSVSCLSWHRARVRVPTGRGLVRLVRQAWGVQSSRALVLTHGNGSGCRVSPLGEPGQGGATRMPRRLCRAMGHRRAPSSTLHTHLVPGVWSK